MLHDEKDIERCQQMVDQFQVELAEKVFQQLVAQFREHVKNTRPEALIYEKHDEEAELCMCPVCRLHTFSDLCAEMQKDYDETGDLDALNLHLYALFGPH